MVFHTLQYVHHNHNEAIQRSDQSPEACLWATSSLSPSLSSISISLALLLSPSVCVLCPLRWSLVSLMVPKMHCGFVGAVRRKGMCACVRERVCVCACVCVWAARGDAVISTHERFSISSSGWVSELPQRHLHTHAHTHTHTHTHTHFHEPRQTTQTEEIHTLCTLDLESAPWCYIVFKTHQTGGHLLFYALF